MTYPLVFLASPTEENSVYLIDLPTVRGSRTFYKINYLLFCHNGKSSKEWKKDIACVNAFEHSMFGSAKVNAEQKACVRLARERCSEYLNPLCYGIYEHEMGYSKIWSDES